MKKEEKKETLRKLTGYSKKEAKAVLKFLKVNSIDYYSVFILLKFGLIDAKNLLAVALTEESNKTIDTIVKEAEEAVCAIKEKIKLNKELQGLSIFTEQEVQDKILKKKLDDAENVIASAGAKSEEMMNLSRNIQEFLIPTNWRPATKPKEQWGKELEAFVKSDKRLARAEFVSNSVPVFANDVGVLRISFEIGRGCCGIIDNKNILEKIVNKEIEFNGKITRLEIYE